MLILWFWDSYQSASIFSLASVSFLFPAHCNQPAGYCQQRHPGEENWLWSLWCFDGGLPEVFRHVRYELVSNFVSRFLELLKLSSSFMSGVRAPYQLVSLRSGSQASQMHRGRKWECLFTPFTCAYCGFGPSLGGNTVAQCLILSVCCRSAWQGWQWRSGVQ